MLKKTLPFILIAFCLHCKPKKDINNPVIGQVRDSVIFYYELSKDESIPTSERYKAINKSLYVLREAKNDTIYNHILYQKNLLHLYLSEYDSLLIYSSQLINSALETGDNFVLARQYYLMGYYFGEVSGNNDKAFQNYTLSKTHFERINDSSWVGRNLINMATIQKNQNDFFGSKETLTEALRYLRLQKDKKHIAHCYNALATNHRKLLNYQDADKYYRKAIAITESEKDKDIYQNNLAATFIDDKQYDKAIGILSVLSQDSVLISNKIEYPRVLDNLAYAQWLLGKNKNVTPFFDALNIRIQNNDKRGQISSYTHLGEFFSKNQPQVGKAYFDTVIGLSKTIKMPRAEKDAIKFKMELEPTNIQLRNRYIFLQDSLYAQELKVKTQFAKYKYDDKLKQESILRLGRENVEKELEVSKQRTQKIVSSSLVGFLLLTLGFSRYLYVQRSRRLKKEKETASLEAIYQTEEELSRRLHDDYGGRLNQAMLLVQNDADKARILDSLEELYKQSRNFSREINDVDTGESFWEGLLAMLQFKTPSNARLFLKGGKETNWTSIPALTKKVIFKVLQELMINMVRHSQASVIAITFETLEKALSISYADDGIGASKKEMYLKNGLRNTEKRIQAIQGTITFDSKVGDGFKAHIQVPK